MLGILPCAGTASRLFNIPKFMLPAKKEQCPLIVHWINLLLNKNVKKIIIGVSYKTKMFIDHVLECNLDEKIRDKIHVKLVGDTLTMNETILECLKDEKYDVAIMGMPDTYVATLSKKLLENISTSSSKHCVGCYLWNIRQTQVGKIGQCDINTDFVIDIIDKDISCNYNYGWGVVVFKPEFEKFMHKDDLHIGYSMKRYIDGKNELKYQIINDGLFFDCGTTVGYTEYLNYMEEIKPMHIKGTLIVVAVYIDNNLKNYHELVHCLVQLRKIYSNEMIIAVNNDSLNTSWFEMANKLNISILHNKSVLQKYEMGAYKVALQHFRADKYIFMQGTIFINNKLDLSLLEKNEEMAIAFGIRDDKSPCLADHEIKILNEMLNKINMNWHEDPILLWNCFCCNNQCLTSIFNKGIFELSCTSKVHSCVFERIWGCYFNKTLKNKITCLPQSCFRKIFLGQQ